MIEISKSNDLNIVLNILDDAIVKRKECIWVNLHSV